MRLVAFRKRLICIERKGEYDYFTFQYGSIQMELDQFISELEEIFTFQYGSIQILQLYERLLPF